MFILSNSNYIVLYRYPSLPSHPPIIPNVRIGVILDPPKKSHRRCEGLRGSKLTTDPRIGYDWKTRTYDATKWAHTSYPVRDTYDSTEIGVKFSTPGKAMEDFRPFVGTIPMSLQFIRIVGQSPLDLGASSRDSDGYVVKASG